MSAEELDMEYPVVQFDTEDGIVEFIEFRTVTYNDIEYAVLIPTEDVHNAEPAIMICRKDQEDGEDIYVEPTEEEFNAVADLVMAEYGEDL